MQKYIKFIRNNSRYIIGFIVSIIIILMLIFKEYTYSFVSTIRDLFIKEPITYSLAIGLIIVTLAYYYTARKTMWHQALYNVQKDYRNKDFLDAVSGLWSFYRDTCGRQKDVMVDNFKFFLETDSFTQLNSDRRLVVHFYYHLAILKHHKIIKKEIIYNVFAEKDLTIIPNILIPLEQLLQDYVDDKDNIEHTELYGKKLLRKLYEGSKNI